MSKLSPLEILSGAYGSQLLTGTTDYTDREYVALVVREDTVIDNLEEGNKLGSVVTSFGSVLTAAEQNIAAGSTVLVAGDIIYPNRDLFSRVKLASGSVMAYRRK